jgi:hypothetical protein
VVHTHPNRCGPEPVGDDLKIADRFRVPVFTITSSGMYVYDPIRKKITKIWNGLDWLKPSKWALITTAGYASEQAQYKARL